MLKKLGGYRRNAWVDIAGICNMWVLGSKGDWTTFILYLVLSVVIGVLLVWAGRAIIR